MAWGTPLTAVANAALTAAQWNASVRDNLLETAPAKSTTAGGLYVGTGTPGSIAERVPALGTVFTSETTTSTSFADLATVGPAVTVTASGWMLVMVSGSLSNNTVNASSYISYEMTGAHSSSATTSVAVRMTSSTANAALTAAHALVRTVTPGSTTLTGKYAVTAGTGTFADRRIAVIPL